jgi:hypothetical protein
MFNSAGRVSTARRQEMQTRLRETVRPGWLISPRKAGEILGLDEDEVRMAVSLGFLKSDYPRANDVTIEQLSDFIGQEDSPDHPGLPPRIEWTFATVRRDELVPA